MKYTSLPPRKIQRTCVHCSVYPRILASLHERIDTERTISQIITSWPRLDRKKREREREMDLELNHATMGAAHHEYSLSDFFCVATRSRRVAKEREKGREKRRKREKKEKKKGSEKRVEPSPLPEYVSLNLNACLSRFPAFGSSWRWCRATSTLIGIWPRSNRSRTHVRERGRIVFRFVCTDGPR